MPEGSRKRVVSKESIQKELEMYEVIKEKLAECDRHLLDEFLDFSGKNMEEDMIKTYANGIIVGILIGVELGNFKE